jgi:hypothetical protein
LELVFEVVFELELEEVLGLEFERALAAITTEPPTSAVLAAGCRSDASRGNRHEPHLP